MRTGAWFSHSESLLLTLLANNDPSDRDFSVRQIVRIRNGEDYGDKSVRARKTPEINLNADNLKGLIDWDKEKVTEPIFTCSISTNDLVFYKTNKFEAPYYPNHTQSTERVVQQVTQAAASVCGHEKRDGYVRARISHRETVPCFKSKKDVMKLFDNWTNFCCFMFENSIDKIYLFQ